MRGETQRAGVMEGNPVVRVNESGMFKLKFSFVAHVTCGR